MDITKAKVTKDNTLVATYMDETGTVTVEGKNLVTNDLINAFKALVLFTQTPYDTGLFHDGCFHRKRLVARNTFFGIKNAFQKEVFALAFAG